MSKRYVRSTDKSTRTWCSWCGSDIHPGPAQHCNPGCLQDELNDARLDTRWTDVDKLYKLRKLLGWPNILNRRQLARSHNRVAHNNRSREKA